MFSWLGKRGSAKPADTVREFLESLTGSPAAVLQQIAGWVTEQLEGGNADLALLQMADERMEPVLTAIDASIAARCGAGTGQKLLRTYCEHFARAYAHVVSQLPVGHADCPRAALRAAHLFARACRLARITQSDPVDLRREILALFGTSQRQGFAAQRKAPYPDMAETSVTQELAVAMLWDTAPFETLTLEQIKYLERFMTFFGNRIVLRNAPGATAPFAVLADGRVVAPGQVDAAAAELFVGPGILAGQMAGIAKLPESDALPDWAGMPLPHTDILTLKELAIRMSATWERKRIQRGSERQTRGDSVRVTGGFDNIRRAVAYAAYVRAGGHLDTYDTYGRIVSARVREVMVGLEKEKRQLAPVEILAAMEAIGDSSAVESWLASDSSARGYSLAVPGFRSWLAVGNLLAVRESRQIDWHVATIRRLYGSSNARRVGIEILHGQPVPVGMGNEGQTANVGLAELRDAILIAGDTENWLITTFPCTPGGTYLVAGHHGRRLFKITARSHSNVDHEIYACAPVEMQAAISPETHS